MTEPSPTAVDVATPEPLLRLEFSVTRQERSEAQSLSIRHQIAGGRKWLSMTILIAILIGLLLALWQTVAKQVPPAYRPYAVGGFIALWIIVFLQQRKAQKADPPPLTLEIFAAGMRFGADGGAALVPWSAFSRRFESDALFLLKDRTGTLLYVIPKRVIPSEQWLLWLRQVTDGGAAAEAVADLTHAPTPPAPWRRSLHRPDATPARSSK